MLSDADLTALLLTLRLAAVTTLILLVLGTPLAWWLVHARFRGKAVLEAIVAEAIQLWHRPPAAA